MVEDPTLGPEACLVESDRESVDCGVDAQLARAAEALGVGGP